MRRKDGVELLLFCVPFFTSHQRKNGREGRKEITHTRTEYLMGNTTELRSRRPASCSGVKSLKVTSKGPRFSSSLPLILFLFFWLSTPIYKKKTFSFRPFVHSTHARSEESKTFPPLKLPPKSLSSFPPLHATRHARRRGSSPSTHDFVSPLFAPTPTKEVVRALTDFTNLQRKQRVPKLEKIRIKANVQPD